MNGYVTVLEPAVTETVIKKSRFIGQLYPVSGMDEAQATVASVKKKYWDARHSCSAVVIGERGEYTRCSDDGEPQGTAGVPMLEALKGTGLTNTLAVVTRYFGGVLLGTGGLARAYSGAVTDVAAAAKRLKYEPFKVYAANVPFKLWGRLESGLYSMGGRIGSIEYAEDVKLVLYVPPESSDAFLQLVSEASAGKLKCEDKGSEYVKTEL